MPLSHDSHVSECELTHTATCSGWCTSAAGVRPHSTGQAATTMLLSRHTRRREIITHADRVAIQGRACRRAPPSRPWRTARRWPLLAVFSRRVHIRHFQAGRAEFAGYPLIFDHQNAPVHDGLACCSTLVGTVKEKVDPCPGLELDPQPPPMQLDDALGNRQSETSATFLLRDRRVGLLELLEDFRLLGFGDARPGVAHRYRERAVGRESLDRHFAGIGELDRVADQVEQDLRELALVAACGG